MTRPRRPMRPSPRDPSGARRDRKRPMKCYVDEVELAELDRLADIARMSRSGYLRAAAMFAKIESSYDATTLPPVLEATIPIHWAGVQLRAWLDGREDENFDPDRLLQETLASLERLRGTLEAFEAASDKLSRPRNRNRGTKL